MIQNQKVNGKDVAYETLEKPLYKVGSYTRYRSIYGDNLERMKNYGIYYWPSFSQTFKNDNPSEECEEDDDEFKKLVFEIYMTEDPAADHGEGHVWSSIDTTRNGNELDYTIFPNEK